MKTTKIILLFALTLIMSCSNEDDSPTISSPSVTYASTNLEALFSQIGNSAAPNVNWNGNQGSFSLASTTEGLNINSTSGVINWTKMLPIGNHNVQVIATNSSGQTTINLTINNPFQGEFIGDYDSFNYFSLDFNSNGTINIKANDESNPSLASGTWALTGNNILINYSYDNGDDYSLNGTLSQTPTQASLSGDWFYDFDAVPANQSGIYSVSLQ